MGGLSEAEPADGGLPISWSVQGLGRAPLCGVAETTSDMALSPAVLTAVTE